MQRWAVVIGVLVAWAYFGISWAGDFLDPSQVARRGRAEGLLLFWVGWGVFAFARLRLAVGRELVEVDARRLVLRRDVAGIGRSRVFDLARVRNLHYVVLPPVRYVSPTPGWQPPPVPPLGGSVRFEYGKRTHEFARGIDSTDIIVVLEALREWVPVASTSSASESA